MALTAASPGARWYSGPPAALPAPHRPGLSAGSGASIHCNSISLVQHLITILITGYFRTALSKENAGICCKIGSICTADRGCNIGSKGYLR